MVVDFAGSIDFSKFVHLDHLATSVDSNPVVMLTHQRTGQDQSISTQKKVAIATKQPEKFYFISGEEKRVATKSRSSAHPEAEKIAMDEVISRWESGNPATTPEIYHLLRTKFEPPTKFHQLYLQEGKQASLSQWFSRVLERQHWSITKSKGLSESPCKLD